MTLLATWGPNQELVDPLVKAKRLVCWFSAGAASATATKIVLDELGSVMETRIVYCDTGSEHPDNWRFLADCERWYGQKIEVLKNEKFDSVDEVFRKRRYIAGPKGAPCTEELKIRMRRQFEQFDDAQVFGFDIKEQRRFNRFVGNNPEVMALAPLLQLGVSKQECFDRLSAAGIELPAMYKLGYKNNNCIGCVKGKMGYWNKIRRDFPERFAQMAAIEREIGHAINSYETREKIDGKVKRIKHPVYLDELDPERGDYAREKGVVCGATGCGK